MRISADDQAVLDHVAARREAIIGRTIDWANINSGSRNAAGLNAVLDALEPAPHVSLHPALLARLGLRAGQPVRLRTRRGSVTVATRADEAVPDGAAFLPFAYAEAAANLLTIAALDPVAKIAEVKHCAVAIEPVAAAATV